MRLVEPKPYNRFHRHSIESIVASTKLVACWGFVASRLLGDEIGTIHSRTELRELLKIHVKHGALDVETGREVAGALKYKELSVKQVMTPVKDCFMLSVTEKLNFKVSIVPDRSLVSHSMQATMATLSLLLISLDTLFS